MANLDLSKYGITGVTEILHNPSYDVLFAEETKPSLEGFEKGQVTELGAVNVMTGIYTGRSPKDKFFVKNEASADSVWWTSDEYKNDNKPCTEEAWADLKAKAVKQLSGKRLFVVDTFCGANEATRMKVRFIMEVAWQAHFVTNMFIRPTAEELANYGEPDFVCFNASKAKVDNYKELGLNSETATVFNLKTKEQVILNTWYGGEMKKGMFSIMNYMNPLRGIASMHCSANTDMEGTSSAIFFGLSGTGKTTLSTDPKRKLIGDDEHGWDNEGVFNYEGGCYAKVINLDKDSEPDIYNAIKRDALLENVTVDANGKIDFTDKSVTENTRVSYPIYHIENIVKPVSKGPHAKQVIFLSADAFGAFQKIGASSDSPSSSASTLACVASIRCICAEIPDCSKYLHKYSATAPSSSRPLTLRMVRSSFKSFTAPSIRALLFPAILFLNQPVCDILPQFIVVFPLAEFRRCPVRCTVGCDNTAAPFSIRSKRDKRIALYSNRNLCLRFCDYLIVTENLRPVGRNAL